MNDVMVIQKDKHGRLHIVEHGAPIQQVAREVLVGFVDEHNSLCDKIERMSSESDMLRCAVNIAGGLISTLPQYADEHPETIVIALIEDAMEETGYGR